MFFPGHLPDTSAGGLVQARELVDAARTCAAQIDAGAPRATWAVTSAPACFASCTAVVPTPLDAP